MEHRGLKRKRNCDTDADMEPDVKFILDDDKEGTTVEIMAHSHVLRMTSPYFRALLAPGRFAEGTALQENKTVVVKLHETNAEAMKAVCDILHHNTKDVPYKTITTGQIAQIAILAGKFECAQALRPWISKWMEESPFEQWSRCLQPCKYDHIRALQLFELYMTRPSGQAITEWLCAAYYFGRLELFHQFQPEMLEYTSEAELHPDGNTCIKHLPQSIIDTLRMVRHKWLSSLHKVLIDTFSNLECGSSCQVPESYNRDYTTERFRCSSISLGSFILACKTELWDDWKNFESWTCSVSDVQTRIWRIQSSLEKATLVGKGSQSEETQDEIKLHVQCSVSAKLDLGVRRARPKYEVSETWLAEKLKPAST